MTLRSLVHRGAAVLIVGAGAALCVGATPSAATGIPSPSAGAPRALAATAAVDITAPAAAVHALATDDTAAAMAAFPADFAAAMGYSPVTEPGFTSTEVLADPDGDCSSPVPLPSSFDAACRVHDLGYDMLRFARDSGQELGPDARRELDAMLARHLRATCESDAAQSDPSCMPAAHLATTFVRLNSWRQGYRIPISESPASFLMVAGLGALPVVLGAWAVRRAARR